MSQPFSPAQAAILGILVLMVFAVCLGIYIFIHREQVRRSERRIREKRAAWLPVVFDFLGGSDEALEELVRLVEKRDFDAFTDHVLEILDSIEGDDVERLRLGCRELGIVGAYLTTLTSVRHGRWAKIHAAHFLGELREQEAEPGLLELLEDDRMPVVLAAGRAIGQLGNLEHLPPNLETLAALEGPSEEAISAVLLEFGPAMAPVIEELLASRELTIREQGIVIDLLAELRHYASVATLCEVGFRTEDHRVEVKVIRALGRLADPQGRALLEEKSKSPDERIRAEAARALGFVADPAAVPALRDCLGDTDWRVRYNAAWSMILIGGEAEREIRELASQPVRDVVVCRQVLGEYDVTGSATP